MIRIDQYYGSPFEKWAKNYCYRNHWRVSRVLGWDIEDFYAQCALWWVQCYEFYKDSVNDDPLMMHMYKLWVTGQVADLSNKETKYKQVMVESGIEEVVLANCDETYLNYEGKSRINFDRESSAYSEAELVLKLEKASSELKEVLKIFTDAPKEIMDVLREECQSQNPKSFFKKVVSYLEIDQSKATSLAKELQDILS